MVMNKYSSEYLEFQNSGELRFLIGIQKLQDTFGINFSQAMKIFAKGMKLDVETYEAEDNDEMIGKLTASAELFEKLSEIWKEK